MTKAKKDQAGLIVPRNAYRGRISYELEADPALRDFLRMTREYAVLSRDDEYTLGQRAQAGDGTARQKLIMHNLRLVVTIASRYAGHGLPLADLINDGVLGLMDGVKHYQPRKDARFCTYAGWWIAQACNRALVNTGSMIRLPEYIVALRIKLHRYIARYVSEHGNTPTEDEMCAATGATASEIRLALEARDDYESIDAQRFNPEVPGYTNDDHAPKLADTLMDESLPEPDDTLIADEETTELHATIRASLTANERAVIAVRFGLRGVGYDGLIDELTPRDAQGRPRGTNRAPSHAELGARLGMSRESVRRIESRALNKLREAYGVTDDNGATALMDGLLAG